MKTIQLSISESGYLAMLERQLSRSEGMQLVAVREPDPTQAGVLVLDDEALDRVSLPMAHPERVVLITRNDPRRLAQAWEAGIRSVVFYDDPVTTAVLAVMAASLRSPAPPGSGTGPPRGKLTAGVGEAKRSARLGPVVVDRSRGNATFGDRRNYREPFH